MPVRCISTGRWAALWNFLCVHAPCALDGEHNGFVMWRVLHKVKYFLLFAFFRGKYRNLWSLQPNFWVRKVWICLINDLADQGLRDLPLSYLLCCPARRVLCRRNLSVHAPKGPNIDFELSREFELHCVVARFLSQTLFRQVKFCDVFFLQEFRLWYW